MNNFDQFRMDRYATQILGLAQIVKKYIKYTPYFDFANRFHTFSTKWKSEDKDILGTSSDLYNNSTLTDMRNSAQWIAWVALDVYGLFVPERSNSLKAFFDAELECMRNSSILISTNVSEAFISSSD